MLCRKSRVAKSHPCGKRVKSKYPAPPPPLAAVERQKYPSVEGTSARRSRSRSTIKSGKGTPRHHNRSLSSSNSVEAHRPAAAGHGRETSQGRAHHGTTTGHCLVVILWRAHRPTAAGHGQQTSLRLHQAVTAGPGRACQLTATNRTVDVNSWRIHQAAAAAGHGQHTCHGRISQGAAAGRGQETSHLLQWRLHQADHVALLQLHLHTYQVFVYFTFLMSGTQLSIVILCSTIGLICDNGFLRNLRSFEILIRIRCPIRFDSKK